MDPEVTVQRLPELLNYDHDTGIFSWRSSDRNRRAGAVAGGLAGAGYIYISLDGKKYLAHRLAWLYVHGNWPKHQIDHINMVRTDNRIANLRDVRPEVNNQNRRKVRSDNQSSGLTGVTWHGHSRKWRARIAVDGTEHRIGLFDDAAEASTAYLQAKRCLHVGCTI